MEGIEYGRIAVNYKCRKYRYTGGIVAYGNRTAKKSISYMEE
jgi:hypothetical protein